MQHSSEFKQVKKISKSKFGTNEWEKGIVDANGDFADLDVLHEWLRLNDDEGRAKKAANAKEAELMQKWLNNILRLPNKKVSHY